MSQMERGERPTMQEQEDSEEGEPPADPSAGEWLPGSSELRLLGPSAGRCRIDPGRMRWPAVCRQAVSPVLGPP